MPSRHSLLADAFKRAGLVERTAGGIDTIFYEQLRNGRPAPSYERSTPTDVVLVLPGGKANLDFVRLLVEQNQAGRLLSLEELLILNRLWQARRLTTSEAAALIQKDDTDARGVLERLVEAGLAEAEGRARGRSYHLSAAAYRQLGEEAGYVRQRGFEPLQQEQMVLQYVRAHGQIARRQASELCRISSLQARDLLQRMVRKDLLKPEGLKKGAHYVQTSTNVD